MPDKKKYVVCTLRNATLPGTTGMLFVNYKKKGKKEIEHSNAPIEMTRSSDGKTFVSVNKVKLNVPASSDKKVTVIRVLIIQADGQSFFMDSPTPDRS